MGAVHIVATASAIGAPAELKAGFVDFLSGSACVFGRVMNNPIRLTEIQNGFE